MKKTILITTLLFSFVFAYAQNKEVDAIAAYQLAEEHFEAKEYEQALEFIETIKNILGSTNSKIQYLQIQVLQELSKTIPKYLQEGLNAIKSFEESPGINEFSEVKRIEIAKIKIDLQNKIKAFDIYLFNVAARYQEQGYLDKAKEYYQKAIQINPKLEIAYINLAVIELENADQIVNEMNNLGNSRADNKKYDELKKKREPYLQEAMEYLEKAILINPDSDQNVFSTLENIYRVLNLKDKLKYLKNN